MTKFVRMETSDGQVIYVNPAAVAKIGGNGSQSIVHYLSEHLVPDWVNGSPAKVARLLGPKGDQP